MDKSTKQTEQELKKLLDKPVDDKIKESVQEKLKYLNKPIKK